MTRTTLAILLGIVGLCTFIQAQDADKDWKDVPAKELGYEPFKPTKDPKTGFVVGGKNETGLIRKLTALNGRSIAALEKDMRPGESSTKGFLGKDENLLDILAMDNDFVLDKLGLTHQELSRHLLLLAAIAEKGNKEIVYHGQGFKLKFVAFRGVVLSPFEDGTKTNKEVEITNVKTGKTVKYSVLVPVMMERYGFYEGKGTPYRVDPRQIVETLDFLAAKKD